jgi:peptidoglycan/LPS O-acetylase OafA/YrhL
MTASAPEDRRFPALNAVRAVAALGVVATHTAFDTGEVNRGPLGALLSRLDFGVALFFVLSGFLLGRPFFRSAARRRPRPSYRHFLWKRALRILPLYWVVVLAALILLPENSGAGALTWATNLTLTQIYTEGLLPTGLTQMWSLCTEVLFYVLLPALTVALLGRSAGSERSPDRVLVGLVLLSVLGFAWQAVMASTSDVVGQHYHQWLPGFLPWFSVGLLFAVASVHAPGRPEGSRWHWFDRAGEDLLGCWLVASAVFAVACTPVAGPRLLITPSPSEALVKSVLYTVSAAFFVLPLVFGPETEGWARRVASSRPAVWMGDISYGIFCLHLLALEAVMDLFGVQPFTGRFRDVFLTTVALTIVLAATSYYLLERPVLRLKNSGPFAPKAPTARTRPRSARD